MKNFKNCVANGILVCEIMQRRMRHGMVFTDSEPCSNSQVLLFHKYVLSASYVPPTLLGIRDISVNKTHICALVELRFIYIYIYIERERVNK